MHLVRYIRWDTFLMHYTIEIPLKYHWNTIEKSIYCHFYDVYSLSFIRKNNFLNEIKVNRLNVKQIDAIIAI